MIRELQTVDADGVQLAVYVSGPPDAPPLILVHGYPDSALVWEPLRALLDHRYRVIAYDVRGAGASDAPRSRRAYRLEQLAADLAAVADATCGTRPFHLVGHDWGSIQCWEAVSDTRFAGRIASYTSISGPCLDHASTALRGGKSAAASATAGTNTAPRERHGMPQFLKSWYIVFFHLPLLPELVWLLGGARLWPLWLRLTERVRAERDPAQTRNALNGLALYRTNFVDRLLHPRPRRAVAPVQCIVPLRDRYVGPELSLGLEPWVGHYPRETIDAGHWVVLREPDRIAALIERFVRQHETMWAANAAPAGAAPGASAAPSGAWPPHDQVRFQMPS
ncbi:alpha/beta fold hydrolase [Paraburkholderia phosphatilytica]|uniref:alpha/beta fold hydrolase n=1 Tax=Paraburkholderia phosphatilytica TaxID=2282883 RepID=UPI000E4901E7|nr:alpha/beta fold hydrolase [Paraburkholderia phosphatilytica]